MEHYRRYTLDDVWRPPVEGDSEPNRTGVPFLDECCALIRSSGYKPLSITAARLGLTAEALTGAMQATTGMNSREWLRQWLIRDAKWLLTHTLLSMGQVGKQLGYHTASNFCHAFQRWTGTPPSYYRAVNSTIRHHVTTEIVPIDEG